MRKAQGAIESCCCTTAGTPPADGWDVGAATSMCRETGFLILRGFGFEYIQYTEGQQITKRQIGAKDLIVRCTATS